MKKKIKPPPLDELKERQIHYRNYKDFMNDGIESWVGFGVRTGFLIDAEDGVQWVQTTIDYLRVNSLIDEANNLDILLYQWKKENNLL